MERTFMEYNIQGQDVLYTVHTWCFKPVAFTNIFLHEENFRKLVPSLQEIFSIVPEKPSINTFQTSKAASSYLKFGKMQFDGKNDSTWISQHVSEPGWMHLHTDFWIPNKSKALKNYIFPEIVSCISGNGQLITNPDNKNFYPNNFSIIIKDELLNTTNSEKVRAAVEKLTAQFYDCYYFHFKAPWIKSKNAYVSSDGGSQFVLSYVLADADGAISSRTCFDHITDCKWKNIYCDESELIEKRVL